MTMQNMRPVARRGQIFISYSRRDTPAVGRLYEALTRARYNVWLDTSESGIEIGSNWRQSLKENVALSAAMIACLSPDFLRSEYCKAEVAQALEEGKPVYPMLMRPLGEGDDALVEAFGLKDIQYGDLTKADSWEPSLRKLRRKLPPPDWLGYFTRYGSYVAAALLTLIVGFLALRGNPNFGGRVLGIPTPQPTPIPVVLDARLGVGVTYFALADEGIDAGQAKALIDRFAGDLRQAISAAALRSELAIGYLAPAELSPQPVAGATPTERRDSARLLTRERGVDMVIYGWIERDANGLLNIYPEFTLIPEELTLADELAEGNRFGKMIAAPAQGTATEAERELARRAESAAEIAAGLAQMATQEIGEYEKAARTFQGVIDNFAGEEMDAVAYVMLGASQLQTVSLLWRQCDAARIETALDAAQRALEAANAADEAYSRPYSGLSLVYFYRARLLGLKSTGDCYYQAYDLAALRQSLDFIDQAKAAAQASPDSNEFVTAARAGNEARVTYAFCTLYLSGETSIDGSICDRFESVADRITDDTDGDGLYDRTRLSTILPYAAMVEAMRGMVAYFRAAASEEGDYQPAIDAYTRAIALREAAPSAENRYQAMLNYAGRADVWLTFCVLDEAADDFGTASQRAGALNLDDAAAYFAGMQQFARNPQDNGCES
jgi:tetratricopeptide (TPR) repeat protein